MKDIVKGVILLACLIFVSNTASGQIRGISIGDSVRITSQSMQYAQITGKVINISLEKISISKGYSIVKLYDIPLEAIDKLEVQEAVKNIC